MYETPVASIYPDVVKLAGGPDAVARRAAERLASGDAAEALRLTDVALVVDSSHRAALEVRLKALEFLRDRCRNSNERGWLDYSIDETQGKLGIKR